MKDVLAYGTSPSRNPDASFIVGLIANILLLAAGVLMEPGVLQWGGRNPLAVGVLILSGLALTLTSRFLAEGESNIVWIGLAFGVGMSWRWVELWR